MMNFKDLFRIGELKITKKKDKHILVYKIENELHVYRLNNLREVGTILLDLYYRYEYRGEALSSHQLSLLLCVSKRTVNKIIARIKKKMKKQFE